LSRTNALVPFASLSLAALGAALLLPSCGSDAPGGAGTPRGGDSLGVHADPLSLDPGIPFLDFDQNADDPKAIALTFDDGPDDTNTAKVLDALKAAGVKATFFINTNNYVDVNASSTARYLIERMHTEGHEIGNHTVHHYDLGSTSTNVTGELDGVYQIMKQIVPGALQQRFVRAPYGNPYFGPQSRLDYVAPIVAHYGVHVGWNIDPQDYDCTTNSCVLNGVLNPVDAGLNGLVLLHATQSHTASALPTLLSSLKSRGMKFVFVEDLVRSKYGKPSRDLVICYSNADCVSGETCGSNQRCAPSGTSDAGTTDSGSSDSGTADGGTTDGGADGGTDGGTGGTNHVLTCSSLTVTSGSVSGASTACGATGRLATQNGSSAIWNASSTSTKTVAYATYVLGGVPSAMKVTVAFRGDDATEPLWYWYLWNPSTGAWVLVGDNSWAGNWSTTAHSFSIASPASYVDATGHVKVRFLTKTSTNSAEMDRMVVEATY
jgi:peptidoglycan/xylan/chitin deacetylase (PgdA/CDA1 family)